MRQKLKNLVRQKTSSLLLAMLVGQLALPPFVFSANADDSSGSGVSPSSFVGLAPLAGSAANGIKQLAAPDPNQPPGGSGNYETLDSCSDTTDPQAKQLCAMKKTSLVAAGSQLVAAATFTTAGILGINACAKQSTDESADKAFESQVQPLQEALTKLKASEADDNAKVKATAADVTTTGSGLVDTFQNTITLAVKQELTFDNAVSQAYNKLGTDTTALDGACAFAGSAAVAPVTNAYSGITTQFQQFNSNVSELQNMSTALQTDVKGPITTDMQTCTSSSTDLNTAVNNWTTEYAKDIKAADAAIKAPPPSLPQFASADGLTELATTLETNMDNAQGAENQSMAKLTADLTSLNTDPTHGTGQMLKQVDTITASAQAISTSVSGDYSTSLAALTSTASSTCNNPSTAVAGCSTCMPALSTAAADASTLTSALSNSATVATNTQNGINAYISQIQKALAAAGEEKDAEGTFTADLDTEHKIETTYTSDWHAAEASRGPREGSHTAYAWGERAAYGVDIAGTIATTAAGAAFGEKLNASQIISTAGTTASGIIAKVTVGGAGKADGGQPTVSCPMEYLLDLGQAGIRGLNAAVSLKAAHDSEDYLKQLQNTGMNISTADKNGTQISGGNTSGGSDTSGGMDAPHQPTLMSGLSNADQAALSPQSIASNMATGANEPLPSVLQNATSTTPEQIASGLENGQSPAQVASAAMGDTAGSEASTLASVMQNQDKFAQIAKTELSKLPPIGAAPQYAFAVPAVPRSRSVASDTGLDMNNLLQALMPKAPAPAGPPGARPVAYGGAATTGKASADGLYPANRSLFEIVDTRYANLSTRFLNGDLQLSAPPPSQVYGADAGQDSAVDGAAGVGAQPEAVILPKNPYLRK